MASSIPVAVPFVYIALLVGSLIIFSRIYRKRTATRIANQEPWFPSHPERDVYISLLQLDPPAPEALLKAALLRRAVADVRRILAFREDKTALQALLQKGSIGDDLWNAFLAAEKELGAELAEVVNEANTFREGWGQFIFQSASEMVNNIKTHDLYMSIPKMKAEAEEKYGPSKPKSAKTLASQLAVPSPQTSAPASPTPKPTIPTVSVPSSSLATSTTLSAPSDIGSPGPSTNGDLTSPSATASPASQAGNLPKTGGKKNKKRK